MMKLIMAKKHLEAIQGAVIFDQEVLLLADWEVVTKLQICHWITWDETMHQEKKNIFGKFFYFFAEKCTQNQIPRDQNPPIKGF